MLRCWSRSALVVFGLRGGGGDCDRSIHRVIIGGDFHQQGTLRIRGHGASEIRLENNLCSKAERVHSYRPAKEVAEPAGPRGSRVHQCPRWCILVVSIDDHHG
ncbi:hypothetical protein BO70DRAFT_365659 [Aspergillus heteromorphus CBS 117.55]|uniref:Uncharacterized protein n=1 Tax=Aspergillus heteromorphus CBS 117.55 TaxID=1448321 RepID=A0A317V8P5_9EURO|nr:uncharacterized protein BO70DRAFT_365659 [Aspergillus heteromorphus CBS 117.55]PWY69729.1 hypothetical protein BO70DRAFT_365659 [Aspergillus heteromorphus CBS 117.55]